MPVSNKSSKPRFRFCSTLGGVVQTEKAHQQATFRFHSMRSVAFRESERWRPVFFGNSKGESVQEASATEVLEPSRRYAPAC